MERKETNEGKGAIHRLLTVKDVAFILGIAPKTVNKLVRERKLCCVQVTTKERRFTEQQVNEYIQSRSSNQEIDTKTRRRVKSTEPKGGEKSLGFTRRSLMEEMRQWQ